MSDAPTWSAERSSRLGLKRILGEAGVLLLAGAMIALAANQLSPRGLHLARDYFPRPTARVAALPAANTPSLLPPGSAAGVAPAILERLGQKGLHAAGHDYVVQLFHDPQYARSVIFVDARDDDHYQAGHIPGALHFDSYHQEKYLLAVLPPCLAASNVVVYCNGGDCEDSEFAALTLSQAGVALDRLLVYAGGMPEWITNGLPVETGSRNSGMLKPAKP